MTTAILIIAGLTAALVWGLFTRAQRREEGKPPVRFTSIFRR